MATPEDPCNCLALRQAARALTQRYDDALAPVGLRVTQFSVLAKLGRLGPSSVQALAADLVMDRSTLGHNLRPLEREGLLALAIDPHDRRAKRLVLTDAGKAKLAEARPLWRAAQLAFERSYGETEAQSLRTSLARVVDQAHADA